MFSERNDVMLDELTTMHSVMNNYDIGKFYSDDPMQCIYALSKCFCTASLQDNICDLVLLS